MAGCNYPERTRPTAPRNLVSTSPSPVRGSSLSLASHLLSRHPTCPFVHHTPTAIRIRRISFGRAESLVQSAVRSSRRVWSQATLLQGHLQFVSAHWSHSLSSNTRHFSATEVRPSAVPSSEIMLCADGLAHQTPRKCQRRSHCVTDSGDDFPKPKYAQSKFPSSSQRAYFGLYPLVHSDAKVSSSPTASWTRTLVVTAAH
ncbi:uncharacterized protein IWZ02DRAFT_313577 [Phyllosticta citriasiana]|uniref:uncharacterized protein n=1 Tax=Phyllosticta citriasiana TaxID=595635 RepID=UPI0030FDA05A